MGTGDVVRELEQELGRELGLELDLEFGLELSCDIVPDWDVPFTDLRLVETGLGVVRGLGVSFFVILASGAKIPLTNCKYNSIRFFQVCYCLTKS